jgi:hypothetical protein
MEGRPTLPHTRDSATIVGIPLQTEGEAEVR